MLLRFRRIEQSTAHNNGSCYKRQMQPLKKTTKAPFVRKPHSIRLVEIPPTSNSTRGIKLSVESAPHHPQPAEAHCPGLRISQLV
ncbi:LIM domain kinase 1 [Homalodisca vitripennis]|nr:LIM domain kinase 1 [Homalodisca vitripennis]